jgi:hypothetical protein
MTTPDSSSSPSTDKPPATAVSEQYPADGRDIPPDTTSAETPAPGASLRSPQYSLMQLARSAQFMAPTHPPAETAQPNCSCRDCRWWQLDNLSVGSVLAAYAMLLKMREDKQIDDRQLITARDNLLWWQVDIY